MIRLLFGTEANPREAYREVSDKSTASRMQEGVAWGYKGWKAYRHRLLIQVGRSLLLVVIVVEFAFFLHLHLDTDAHGTSVEADVEVPCIVP